MKFTSSLSVAAFAVCLLAQNVFATTYQSANGYQITVPDNFSPHSVTASIQNENINIEKKGFDSLFVGPNKEVVSVVIENVPPGVTLPMMLRYMPSILERGLTSKNTQVSANGLPMVQNKTRMHVLSKGYTTVGGVKAFTILSRIDTSTGSSLTRQAFVIRHGWLMTFSCGSASKNFWKVAPAFNRTLTTVRWMR